MYDLPIAVRILFSVFVEIKTGDTERTRFDLRSYIVRLSGSSASNYYSPFMRDAIIP